MSLLRRFWNAPPATWTEALFLRLLGLVYLSAFASLWPQVPGLIGDHGIAPVAESLKALQNAFGLKAYFYVPTVFWLNHSNVALTGACLAGSLAALLMMSGLFTRYATAICFLLYLSLTTAGQPFTGFQWDALLLECGFLALFAGAPLLIWAYRFLLFRLMFESGAVKLVSHDPNWQSLHALRFHFLTQPLPTPLAYYFYRAPTALLDFMTMATLAIELVVPFFVFLPRYWRIGAGLSFIFLQFMIIITGNYAFFNLLTLCLCLWCFDDATYRPLSRLLSRMYPPRRLSLPGLSLAAKVGLCILMFVGMLQVFSLFNQSLSSLVRSLTLPLEPFEVVNSYGLFAVMTTTRPEIVLEGSNDEKTWQEYGFPYKPGELHRGLPLIAPYQPRLDWQMWFAALGPYRSSPWTATLIFRLLQGEPSVTKLFSSLPFTEPPRYIRAQLYDYTFSSPADRTSSGVVWHRSLLGEWLGPLSLPTSGRPTE